jgi:endonuclease/exonuclease/phosphatase family metal-dependent hydrolase
MSTMPTKPTMPTGPNMRVATFNLLHGSSPVDGVVDKDRLAAAVRSLDADVLGLQEVDRDQERSHRLDLAAVAAEAMDAVAWRFAPALAGTPGGTWRPATASDPPPGGPAYGVALASRLPVRSWQVVRLPVAPVRAPVVVGRRPRRVVMLLDDEPRIALAAVLETASGPLTVAVTHLSFVPGWNLRQLVSVRRALRALPGPRILLGDLNLPGRLPAAVTRWPDAFVGPTYPSTGPRVQLDHVLVEPGRLAVVGGGVAALGISDHCAGYADLFDRAVG